MSPLRPSATAHRTRLHVFLLRPHGPGSQSAGSVRTATTWSSWSGSTRVGRAHSMHCTENSTAALVAKCGHAPLEGFSRSSPFRGAPNLRHRFPPLQPQIAPPSRLATHHACPACNLCRAAQSLSPTRLRLGRSTSGQGHSRRPFNDATVGKSAYVTHVLKPLVRRYGHGTPTLVWRHRPFSAS